MNRWYKLIPTGDSSADVHIFDDIGYNLQFSQFERDLGDTQNIRLIIDSHGGNGGVSRLCYHLLQPRNISVLITGACMSAANDFLLAAPKGKVSATRSSRLMIHEPQFLVHGNSEQILAWSKAGDASAIEIAHRLSERTGQPFSVVREWLKTDTYFSAEEALKIGLIDSVVDDPPPAPAFPEAVGTVSAAAVTESESLLLELLNAFGDVETKDKKRLMAQLKAWTTAHVKEIAR